MWALCGKCLIYYLGRLSQIQTKQSIPQKQR